jgi:hypothetical protein
LLKFAGGWDRRERRDFIFSSSNQKHKSLSTFLHKNSDHVVNDDKEEEENAYNITCDKLSFEHK